MKKTNWFKKIFVIIFIIFLGLYIASISGYYEAKVSSKVALTEDAIKQFEEDVLNGKNVDINTYIIENNNDYSNGFTKAGERVNASFEKLVSEGFTSLWEAIKVLFF